MNENPTVPPGTDPAAEQPEAAQAAANGASDYGGDNVQILRDAAHIRQRPGMYIGNTSTAGLHHLVYELVYNSVDEALAGYCQNVVVKIHVDNSCTVEDDGRGIPVELHAEHGLPTLQVVMTMLGTSGKFDNAAYKTSAGLHGMGSKAVTALSEWTEARVRRNGRTYMQQYERGKASTEVKDIGASTHTGTSVTFRPDPEIFHEATFSFDTLDKGGLKPIGADFREGLTAIVSVQLPTPQFESQTKIKLNNSEVEGAVSSAVSDYLSQYLEEHPKEGQKLIAKIVLAAEARIA